jgi:glycosyltransferase involved in cell wall biosynthesis
MILIEVNRQRKMIQTELQPQEVRRSEEPHTVSVIIPAYNAAQYIGEALDSVFHQSFSSYEVIVINDGSPDTDELERELQVRPSSLRYIKQANRGAAAARNAGLRVARGEFVAFLDADDRWLPNYLEQQMAFLIRSKADLVYSDAKLFGDSELAGRTFMDLQPSRGEVTPESLLAVKVTVLTSAVLARKAPILEVGLFNEGIRRGHDFELWLRLAKHGTKFAYQRQVLLHHRIVESGLSGDTISQLERTLSVLETIGNREDLTAGEKAALQFNLDRTRAYRSLEDGKERLLRKDFQHALESFEAARQFHRSWKLMFVCMGMRITPELLRRVYVSRTATSSGNASDAELR